MTLPDKLPVVRGGGPISKGFRMTWQTINQLIDYARSTTVRPGQNAFVSRSTHGTTVTPSVSAEQVTATESDGGRWA